MQDLIMWPCEKAHSDWPLGGAITWKNNIKMAITKQP